MASICLEVLTPVGEADAKEPVAHRVSDLHGKTICELSNGSFRSAETLAIVEELLQARFPDAKFVPYTLFGYYHPHDINKVGKQAKAAGCDAVVAGNGG